MKKILLPLVLSALGVGVLAGCTATRTSITGDSTPSGLHKEIVSTALLAANANASGLKMAQREASVASPSSLVFDPNDIPSSLASFDALSLDSYGIKSTITTSDVSGYETKEEIVYTTPDGVAQSVVLYYNTLKTADVSVTVSAPASSETVTSSSETPSSSETNSSLDVSTPLLSSTTSQEEKEDEDEERKLHGFGFRHGGFNSLMGDHCEFDDFEDDGGTIVGSWRKGLADIAGVEYRFFSEELTVTEGEESTKFSSFILAAQANFLAVEQVNVLDGTEKETAYAYTAFQNGGYTRFLLTEEDDGDRRLAYLTPLKKVVINRFTEEGKILYSLHAKVHNSMKLVGLYEKVITTAEDGSQVVSYVVHETTSQVPTED